MATATSAVEVCNLSLDLLRHKERITSIEIPVSDVEAFAARWYDVTRRSVLENFSFNCANTRAALSLNATAPVFGYADAYDLPSDYLALRFIGDDPIEDYETDYTIEGNQILIDNSGGATLNIGYTYDLTTVALFSPLLVDLLAAELAVRMANNISGLNKSMKETLAWKKELELRARSKNGQSNPPKVRYVSPILESRRGVSRRSLSTDGVHLFS